MLQANLGMKKRLLKKIEAFHQSQMILSNKLMYKYDALLYIIILLRNLLDGPSSIFFTKDNESVEE